MLGKPGQITPRGRPPARDLHRHQARGPLTADPGRKHALSLKYNGKETFQSDDPMSWRVRKLGILAARRTAWSDKLRNQLIAERYQSSNATNIE